MIRRLLAWLTGIADFWRDNVPPIRLWPQAIRYILTHKNYQSGKGDKGDS